MATKPTYKPTWAQNDATLPNAGTDNKLRPTSDLRDVGIDYGQQLTAQEFNWIVDNLRQWVDYLEEDVYVASGTSDAATTSIGLSSYNSEEVYKVQWPATNQTPTPTLEDGSLGSVVIKDLDGNSIEPNDIIGGRVYRFWYNGTNFIVLDELESRHLRYNNSDSSLSSSDVNNAIDELDSKVGVSLQDIFPVGSVAFRPTNPGNSVANGGFGFGTWTQVQGKVLVGVGSNTDANGVSRTFSQGDEGGEYKHQLTINEMPSHSHDIITRTGEEDVQGGSAPFGSGSQTTESTESTGGSSAHNNVQPYLAVYMWYRTA